MRTASAFRFDRVTIDRVRRVFTYISYVALRTIVPETHLVIT